MSAVVRVIPLGIVGLFVVSRLKKSVRVAPPEAEVARVEQRDVPVCGERIGTIDGTVNAKLPWPAPYG